MPHEPLSIVVGTSQAEPINLAPKADTPEKIGEEIEALQKETKASANLLTWLLYQLTSP